MYYILVFESIAFLHIFILPVDVIDHNIICRTFTQNWHSWLTTQSSYAKLAFVLFLSKIYLLVLPSYCLVFIFLHMCFPFWKIQLSAKIEVISTFPHKQCAFVEI